MDENRINGEQGEAAPSSASPKKKIDLLWLLCMGLCIGVFAYSAWQLLGYWQEVRSSENFVSDLAQQTVTLKTPEPASSGQTQQEEPAETAPIAVDFAALQAQNAEVVAWLYCPDTVINYPVAQSTNNSKYLYTLLDGTSNQNGTLFMDFRSEADFSHANTILYGHNMKSGKMFGTLDLYKSQSYFDEHPLWYLLTPQGDYKLEIAAGWVTQDNDPLYVIPAGQEEIERLLQDADRKSAFDSGITLSTEDKLVTLSTCSYENEKARYVLLGRLVPLG